MDNAKRTPDKHLRQGRATPHSGGVLHHLTCQTLTRFIRVAWISFQPNGDISFGLSDRTYISPAFRARNYLFNAYNRVGAEYEQASDPSALEPVRNPHFTYHSPIRFHLKSDKARAKKDEALFVGLCNVPIVLSQQDEMPWIRATTAPLKQLKSAGLAWRKVPTNDLPLKVSSEDGSLQISVDFIQPSAGVPNVETPPWSFWTFVHSDVGVRLGASLKEPRIATLACYHFY